MSRLSVGVVFGGVSPEHEVSVITGLQAAAALDRTRFAPVPVYVGKSGVWYTGEGLFEIARYRDLNRVMAEATPVHLARREGGRAALVGPRRGLFGKPLEAEVDVLLLALHGGAGESGAVQGLCEATGVPYTGSGVLGSALGMDKVLTKMLCRDQGIPVVDWVAFREHEWTGQEEARLDALEAALAYPVVVKPARLGSSIGIAKADTRAELDAAVEEALRYDDKIVVERAVAPLREVNCAVLGTPHRARASVIEEPVRTNGERLLTFQEKYQRGGGKAGAGAGASGGGGSQAPRGAGAKGNGAAAGMASLDRLIPAPLPEATADEVRRLAVLVFQLFECSGVARVDFLLDAEGRPYFNEINTIPGSFSFYLWDPAGLPFDALLGEMIEQAVARYREEGGRIRSYETNLLATASFGGAKG
ncbi:MAG: D-alanine--D-alanine ligase family protein [Rubricoccaceae bacterium]